MRRKCLKSFLPAAEYDSRVKAAAEAALKTSLRLQEERSKTLAECDQMKDQLRQLGAECAAWKADRAATSEIEVLPPRSAAALRERPSCRGCVAASRGPRSFAARDSG